MRQAESAFPRGGPVVPSSGALRPVPLTSVHLTAGHELYCVGHLLQAAVTAARTGRAPDLVEMARRAADHVCATFGPGRDEGVCEHPVIETGLVELYLATGERRYLDQARWFVERRGQRSLPEHEFGWAYFQDDVPVQHGETGSRSVQPGAVTITRRFTAGEEICLELPLRPRWTFPDPRIDAVRGCVAVEVGPLVLCAESVDLEPAGTDLDDLRVDTTEAPQADAVKGWFAPRTEANWPYGGTTHDHDGPRVPRVVPLVPYHRWARRGPTTMRVWLPTAPA